MRHSSKIIALVGLLLLVFTLGAATTDTKPANEEQGILLWESTALNAPSHARHFTVVLGVEDVTNDGLPDIIAAMAEHITIYSGDGSGGFSHWQDIPLTDRTPMAADPWPFFLVSAGTVEDLDNDGSFEIIVAGEFEESISVSSGKVVVLASNEEQYEIADEISCSGPPRTLEVWHDSPRVTSLWLSNELVTGEQIQRLVFRDGVADESETLLTLEPLRYATFGDLNQDGYLDVLVRNMDEGVEILSGNEEGTLGASERVTDLSRIYDLTLADMNADGQQEVIGCGTLGIAAITAPWPADESHITIYDFGLPVSDAQFADFNVDGIQDVIAIADRFQRVIFLAGDSTDGFAFAQTFIPTQPVMWGGNPVVVRDLDMDGAPDLVLQVQYGMRVMMNGGDAPWGTSQIPFGGDKLLAVGDLDEDGDPDIITQGFLGLDILWNHDGVLVLEADVFPLDRQWCKTALVSEERLYALSTQASGNRLPDRIWLSVFDLNQNLIANHLLGSDVLPVLAYGDLDNDGQEDVFGTHDDRLWVAWSGTELIDYEVGTSPSLVAAVGSEHGGHDLIVVSTNEYADILSVSFANREAAVSDPLLQLLTVPFAMTSTDWDGDDLLDALFVAMDYAITLEEGDTTPTATSVGAELGVVTAAGDTVTLELDGFPERDTVMPFVAPVVRDLDGDGVLELAYTTTSGAGIFIHELGETGPPTVIDKGIGPLLASDLDGNGINELIGSTLGLFPVVWIQWNGGGQ